MAPHAGPLEPIDEEAIDPGAIGVGVGDEDVVQGARGRLIARIPAMIRAHVSILLGKVR